MVVSILTETTFVLPPPKPTLGCPKSSPSQGYQQLTLNNQQGLDTSGRSCDGRGGCGHGRDRGSPGGSSSNLMENDNDDQTPALYLHQGVNILTLVAKGSE